MTANRGVSTVIDVAMALVLISASVMMLVVFLDTDDPDTQPMQADRTAETLMTTTITTDYSVDSVKDYDEEGIFEDGAGDDQIPDEAFERTAHGPAAGLLADSALAKTEFWGERLTHLGDEFAESIDGALRSEFTGIDIQVRVDAVWRPYEGSGIEGHTEAGRSVPPDVDVNSVTITAPSGFPDVSDEIRERRASSGGDFNESATIIASAIVDGFLPPEEMQRALERQGIDRKMAAYRYDRMSKIVSEYDSTLPDGYYGTGNLDKTEVNAWHLNDRMVGNLSTSLGTTLFGNGLSEPIEQELEENFDSSIDGDALAEKVTTGEVQITVRTWETHDQE